MSKQARCVFRFSIRGNGRDTVVIRQPLSGSSNFAVATQGAVSLNSPAMMTQVYLKPGWNQLVDPAAYLTSPTARNYFALIPPSGSTFMKVLAGATTDVGVSMTPNVGLWLGLPAGPVGIFVYNDGPTGEVCDQWNW